MPIIKVFRRFHSNNISARQAVTEISNLVPGSNVELSERSSAAPFTSKRPIRRKVVSADRRVMLESFVNKYRAMNLGKFPSPTSAQKEVGGSYYIIRKMLQEMEYNVRISSEEKGLVKENKKLTKGEDTINREIAIESSGSQEESNSQVTINQQLSEDPLLESKGEDTINREIAIESSGSQEESNSQVTINQQLSEDPLLESKGEDTINREIAIESSGSQEESNSQVTINQQLSEDHLLESKGEDTINRETAIEESGSQEESNSQVTTNQQLSEDLLLESKGDDTIYREIAIEASGSQEESNSQVTINQQLSEDPLLESKGKDTINREIAIESSGSQEESNSQVTINQQHCEDPLLESVSNFELKEGLQPSTSSGDAGNSNVTRHDTYNIATKSDDIKAQCHQKPEQKPKDESPSEDKLENEDSQSKVEKQHDGIRNDMRDMPEQQKDDELREKPSLWGNLKLMATEFFNIWKK